MTPPLICFLTDRTHADSLRVLFDGVPMCEVPESGGATWRMADVSAPERVAAKEKVYSIKPSREKSFSCVPKVQ